MGKHTNIFHQNITRRDVLKTLGAASAAGMMMPFMGKQAFARSNDKPPNIIFILSDDHRWDALSSEGHPFIQTPNMDKLASEGISFNNAFVTTSLCSPSRASFLTGQYAHTHGVKNNLTPWKDSNVTFLEIMKNQGYDTAFIGKWHMPGKIPTLRGMDKFITFDVQAGQGKYFNCPLIIDGKEVPSRKPYITEELTDHAIEFMGQNRDNPFCLYLSHKAVHHQFKAAPEHQGMYDNVPLNLPKESDPWITWTNGSVYYGAIMGPMEKFYRDYCEAIVSLDQQIGRVMEKVEEMGIADNTIIIYTSDNGYFWGEHHLVDKRWFYEESIHIPFIVRHPKMISAPGKKVDQMILNIDVAPTILDLAGIPVPDSMEGKSFTPILKNNSTPWRKAWLYEYFKEFPYQVPEMNAVRTERYKYIEYKGKESTDLFDIINDPNEKMNLINTAEGQKLIPELKKMLEDLKEGKAL
ncbi:MAG: sulfatase-like hydrolase/transferase [Deltaproteobacteria bacterium]|nr:sulfatase-like hydrolase/transferase [Deltaproteobacteria bacterium]